MIPILYLVLPTLGIYVMLSIFFLRRPHLLHTTWAPAFPIRLAAHRGGSGERLENTMEAMKNAMAQQADILELDCQLTRDGVVVVSHDKNLSRQSGLNKDVDSLDFKELPLIWTSEKNSIMKKCMAAVSRSSSAMGLETTAAQGAYAGRVQWGARNNLRAHSS